MRKLKGWQKIFLAGAGLVLPTLSCSQRSLVLVDVHAPQNVTYTNVTVIITANKEQKTTFDKVTFDASGVFHAGVYIPSDMTGTVALHGDVDESNCIVGSGDASTNVSSEGETTTVVPLPITQSATCVSGTGGSAGSSATGGAGGMVGAAGSVGAGGSGGLTGAAGGGGSLGAGGVNGAGGAAGMGGKGGVTGSGGATGAGGSATASGGHSGSGSGGVNGSGGSPTTGSGGSPTTGSGGIKGSGGAGGLGGGGPTGGAGGLGGVMGSGGLPTTGSGGSGCACVSPFVCASGSTACVCSQTDAEACASIACGSTTNTCQQTVTCPDTCPTGYSCLGNVCRQLTTTGCGGDIVATGTGLTAGTSAAPICPAQ